MKSIALKGTESPKEEAAEDSSIKSASDWHKKIMAITDPKLIRYIQDCCEARLKLGAAHEKLTHKPTKNDPYPPYDAPKKKMAPVVHEEDPEEMI